MALPEKDPLTMVYEALWDILEANVDFCALVPSPYRIKYTDNGSPAFRFPERATRQPTEHPQVVIEATGGAISAFCSSCESVFDVRFAIWVLTGDRRLCYEQGDRYQGLFPVQWSVVRAMHDWEAHMDPLTWNENEDFVTHCEATTHQHEMTSSRFKEQQAPIKSEGWTLVLTGRVEFVFPFGGSTGLQV